MCSKEYFENEHKRVVKIYNKSKHLGFKNKLDLADWFVSELKKNSCKCYYCGTSIHDISRLIDAGLLVERKIGYGYRGRPLEIDKNDSTYTKQHCVLSCYYCNNDKSYTSTKEDYKQYFGPNRKKYFEILLNKLDN